MLDGLCADADSDTGLPPVYLRLNNHRDYAASAPRIGGSIGWTLSMPPGLVPDYVAGHMAKSALDRNSVALTNLWDIKFIPEFLKSRILSLKKP